MRARIAVVLTLGPVLVLAVAADANPTARCYPQRAAIEITRTPGCIIGTNRADTIPGTADGEKIYGWAGDDRIAGGAGDDHIQSGAEDDIVYGGAGNDVIDGALGDDEIFGGPGDDLLKAGGGTPDFVVCGPGDDTARVDRFDTVGLSCEHVIVSRGYSTP